MGRHDGRNDERSYATDDEQLPPVGRSYEHAEQGYNRAAEGHGAVDDCNVEAAPLGSAALRRQCDEDGEGAAETQSRQHARPGESPEGRRGRRQQGKQPEHGDRDDQHSLASDPVGYTAAQQRSAAQPQRARTEKYAQMLWIRLELANDSRGGNSGHLQVDTLENRAQGA